MTDKRVGGDLVKVWSGLLELLPVFLFSRRGDGG